jgi:hypothetical protein
VNGFLRIRTYLFFSSLSPLPSSDEYLDFFPRFFVGTGFRLLTFGFLFCRDLSLLASLSSSLISSSSSSVDSEFQRFLKMFDIYELVRLLRRVLVNLLFSFCFCGHRSFILRLNFSLSSCDSQVFFLNFI